MDNIQTDDIQPGDKVIWKVAPARFSGGTVQQVSNGVATVAQMKPAVKTIPVTYLAHVGQVDKIFALPIFVETAQ